MGQAAFLQRFPALQTRDPDRLLDWLSPAFSLSGVAVGRSGSDFDCVINHKQFDSLSLTYSSYGTDLTSRLQQNDFFIQGLPVSGSGEVCWNGRTVSVSAGSGGIVGGPGSVATFSYDETFSHMVIKFSTAALTRKLSAMIGQPIDPPLRLVDGPDSNSVLRGGQLRLARFLAEELDNKDGPLPTAALVEIEQAILTTFLTASSHNYSHWLNGKVHSVSPWQVRCAAEYIEQHWDQPITIEALSHITQTSARSLFHLFKRTYGVSPMVFVRRVRLLRAKAMLSAPEPETSVTSVGFQCGFSNLGHFAKSYFEAFGERPSDTLRANR